MYYRINCNKTCFHIISDTEEEYRFNSNFGVSTVSFTNEVKPWLVKRPLKTNGSFFGNLELTFLLKEASEGVRPISQVEKFTILLGPLKNTW